MELPLTNRCATTAGRVALALYAAFLLGIAVWRPWTEPAAFGTGVPQVEDILLNTFGAALGYALFRAVPHAETAELNPHAESAEGAE